jgi:hypothetical protein
MKMQNNIAIILQKLAQPTQYYDAIVGFDACIDNIVKVVKQKNSETDISYFGQVKEFGEYIASKENKSCGLDLRTQISKLGGNMAITANALGNLGISTNCIGTFGWPTVLPIFRSMSANCNLITIGETVTTTALEFNDAKVMMCDLQPYDKLAWDHIKACLGIDALIDLFSNKHLVSFLNWSEIQNSTDIWEGILTNILPFVKQPADKPLFFCDLSDCSSRPQHEIIRAIKLLERVQGYYSVIISLNQNEAELTGRALGIQPDSSVEKLLADLSHIIPADMVVIHRRNDAWASDGKDIAMAPTFFTENPAILTGGGDNFNAGFSYARLIGLNLQQSLILANATSGYYVKYGESPSVGNLQNFLSYNR